MALESCFWENDLFNIAWTKSLGLLRLSRWTHFDGS